MPKAAQPLAHEDVGRHRLAGFAAKGRARTRRQGAKLGDHLAHVFVIDAADLAQAVHVTARQQVEIIQQGDHGRIAAVALLELQHQALADVAGENAGRLEAL